jgi:hypothetical protein
MKKNILFIALLLKSVITYGQSHLSDNSFLIEEAYNQEKGVVQHILVSQFNNHFNQAEYSFTQEWPLGSENHQVSYSLPYSFNPGFELHGMEVQYRYQLVSQKKLFIAPALSLILPFGNTHASDEAGMMGFQINVPLSFEISPRFSLHVNLGNASTWDISESESHPQQSEEILYGASLIYFLTPDFNLILEALHTSATNEYPSGEAEVERSTVINPGFRFAINFSSGLQIVPGFSVPFEIQSKENFYFLYLSFEHPFKKIKS